MNKKRIFIAIIGTAISIIFLTLLIKYREFNYVAQVREVQTPANSTPTPISYPEVSDPIIFNQINTGLKINSVGNYKMTLSTNENCQTDNNILVITTENTSKSNLDEDYQFMTLSIVNKDLNPEDFIKHYSNMMNKVVNNNPEPTPFVFYPFCGGSAYFPSVELLDNLEFPNSFTYLYLGGMHAIPRNIKDISLSALFYDYDENNVIQMELNFNLSRFIDTDDYANGCQLKEKLPASYVSEGLDTRCLAQKIWMDDMLRSKISSYVISRANEIGFSKSY